jgi:flagellin-like hook-associated protein FlgL
MPTRAEVEADIASKITDKTPSNKVSNIDDGSNRNLILDYIDQEIDTRQEELVSGTNIKTVNGESLLGEGNIDVGGESSLPYGVISFFLSISEGTPTFTIKQNDYPDSTVSMSIPSNGKVRITTTENVFNTSTKLMATIFNVGGQMYFGVPNYNLLSFPTWFLDIDLKKFDNTQTGTPNITNIYFEIRIFNE